MAFLGFTAISCEKSPFSPDNGGGGAVVMYGCPYASFQAKGDVHSETGEPIEGIKVSRYGQDLGTTDKEGKFSFNDHYSGFISEKDTLVLNFHDIDGPANGGRFEDTQAIVTITQTEKPSKESVWYEGTFTASDAIVVMKKVSE